MLSSDADAHSVVLNKDKRQLFFFSFLLKLVRIQCIYCRVSNALRSLRKMLRLKFHLKKKKSPFTADFEKKNKKKKNRISFSFRWVFILFLDTFKLIDLFLKHFLNDRLRWIFFAAWRDWALTAPWCNLDRDLCCTMITETYITCI